MLPSLDATIYVKFFYSMKQSEKETFKATCEIAEGKDEDETPTVSVKFAEGLKEAIEKHLLDNCESMHCKVRLKCPPMLPKCDPTSSITREGGCADPCKNQNTRSNDKAGQMSAWQIAIEKGIILTLKEMPLLIYAAIAVKILSQKLPETLAVDVVKLALELKSPKVVMCHTDASKVKAVQVA